MKKYSINPNRETYIEKVKRVNLFHEIENEGKWVLAITGYELPLYLKKNANIAERSGNYLEEAEMFESCEQALQVKHKKMLGKDGYKFKMFDVYQIQPSSFLSKG